MFLEGIFQLSIMVWPTVYLFTTNAYKLFELSKKDKQKKNLKKLYSNRTFLQQVKQSTCQGNIVDVIKPVIILLNVSQNVDTATSLKLAQ